MHSFPVLLTLAVLNVAQSSPLPKVPSKPIAPSTRQHRTVGEVPRSTGHKLNLVISRAALIQICIDINETIIIMPNGGFCDGKTEYVRPDDPILQPSTVPSVGDPLATAANTVESGSVLGVKIKGSLLGIPIGSGDSPHNDNPSVASPDAPSSTDHDDDNGGLLSGIGSKFLGLGNPDNTGSSSNSGSRSGASSNSKSSSRDGKDGRNGGLSASLGLGHGSKSSQNPSNANGIEGDDDDDSYIPGTGPVFAGEYGPGGEQPHGSPVGDHGYDGPGEDNHGYDGPDGDEHGQGGADPNEGGHHLPDADDPGYDGAEGGDHKNDGPDAPGPEGGDHGWGGSDGGSHGHNGFQGSHGGDREHDGAHGTHGYDGTDGADHRQDGYEGVRGSDHGPDGAHDGGVHGPNRADGGDRGPDGKDHRLDSAHRPHGGYSGKDGHKGNDGSDHGYDRPEASDRKQSRPDAGDHGRESPGSGTDPEDCDEDNIDDRSHRSAVSPGHSLGSVQLPHGRSGQASHKSQPHLHPWSPKQNPSPPSPKHDQTPHGHKEKSPPAQPHHRFASHSPGSSLKWTDNEPEHECEQ